MPCIAFQIILTQAVVEEALPYLINLGRIVTWEIPTYLFHFDFMSLVFFLIVRKNLSLLPTLISQFLILFSLLCPSPLSWKASSLEYLVKTMVLRFNKIGFFATSLIYIGIFYTHHKLHSMRGYYFSIYVTTVTFCLVCKINLVIFQLANIMTFVQISF